MAQYLTYLLLPLMAILLVSAQALWASGIKINNVLSGSLPQIIINVATNWKMVLGAIIYVLATAVYFILLSRVKFFSVQVIMTALSIVFSVILSTCLFHERPSLINLIGIAIIFVGILLVTYK